MDKLIDQLEQLTNTIIDRLDTVSFEEVEQFVEERQEFITMIEILLQSSTMSNHQKVRIQNLLQHDSSIVNRMQILMDEAREWLQQRNIAKAQRNVYDSAYSSESILMDRFK
ncbi:hypothetical protein [Paenibacillus antarcticus]|uniref:Flagellar protein FliT n=1 Tax=Paenibacillus antarcticus TaxID=253703 RepID=A0A168KCZ4_9BACL|nr:hypothetical protein [Paenibacillus antarcticus]OAB41849.1 hypothetical protein PBAT_20950 [Paenibacillus antarcticus]